MFNLFVVSVFCSIQNNESDDGKSILEDILKRLDEKEARLSQLEAIVSVHETTMREQQGQIKALEEEVAIQKTTIRDLQEQSAVEPEFDEDRGDPDEASADSGRNKGTFYSSYLHCTRS